MMSLPYQLLLSVTRVNGDNLHDAHPARRALRGFALQRNGEWMQFRGH